MADTPVPQTLTVGSDGRVHVHVTFTPAQAVDLERAADGIPAATFARRATLRAARAGKGEG